MQTGLMTGRRVWLVVALVALFGAMGVARPSAWAGAGDGQSVVRVADGEKPEKPVRPEPPDHPVHPDHPDSPGNANPPGQADSPGNADPPGQADPPGNANPPGQADPPDEPTQPAPPSDGSDQGGRNGRVEPVEQYRAALTAGFQALAFDDGGAPEAQAVPASAEAEPAPEGLSSAVNRALEPVLPPGLAAAITSPLVIAEALARAVASSGWAALLPAGLLVVGTPFGRRRWRLSTDGLTDAWPTPQEKRSPRAG